MVGFGYYSYFMNKGDDDEMSDEMLNDIVVAGGCFWGVQEYYTRLKGVDETKVGYAQGTTVNPTYEEVCEGNSGFTEVVHIKYNPETISLTKICDHLFRLIDPLSVNKQGGDVGINYRTGIYYNNEVDKKVIDKYIAKQQKKYYSSIAVEVEKLENFYDAEDYHQEYLKKNIYGYCHVDFSKIKDTEKKSEYL
jgi:methionine-S-sulfoxide reductase